MNLPARLDRIILAVLIVAALAVSGYYLFTLVLPFWTETRDRSVSFVLPSAAGLERDQIVNVVAGSSQIGTGRVVSLRTATNGVLVTVALDIGLALGEGARAVLRPAPPPKPASLEIRTPIEMKRRLNLPAAIPGEIELGPPEGLLEPAPRWPEE